MSNKREWPPHPKDAEESSTCRRGEVGKHHYQLWVVLFFSSLFGWFAPPPPLLQLLPSVVVRLRPLPSVVVCPHSPLAVVHTPHPSGWAFATSSLPGRESIPPPPFGGSSSSCPLAVALPRLRVIWWFGVGCWVSGVGCLVGCRVVGWLGCWVVSIAL